MEDDIIFIDQSTSNAKIDESMDIFDTDTEDESGVIKKSSDSNLSADIFDVSDDDVEEVLPSPSSSSSKKKEEDNAVDSDIEIISPEKKSKKQLEKENISDDFDSIEIISPVKKEPKPFFIPRDPNKPKIDLTEYLKKPEPSKQQQQTKLRLTPIRKKNAKEEEKKTAKKNLTKALVESTDIASSSQPTKTIQTKIDSIFKRKDDKATEAVEPSETPQIQPAAISNGYRTPSPRRPRGRSASPTYSPLDPDIAAKLKAALESPGFLEKRHSTLNTVLEKAKQAAMKHPRCKFSRALMNGYECQCCKDFYDAMGLEGEARREYVNRVSKHRGWEQAPPTPPRYWDLDVPSKEEQVQLGYVIETDSPLIKAKPPKTKH